MRALIVAIVLVINVGVLSVAEVPMRRVQQSRAERIILRTVSSASASFALAAFG